MPQASVDQIARDSASQAMAAISTHEQVCAQRQGFIIERLNKIERMIGRALVWAIVTMGSIIVTLLGLLAQGAKLHF